MNITVSSPFLPPFLPLSHNLPVSPRLTPCPSSPCLTVFQLRLLYLFSPFRAQAELLLLPLRVLLPAGPKPQALTALRCLELILLPAVFFLLVPLSSCPCHSSSSSPCSSSKSPVLLNLFPNLGLRRPRTSSKLLPGLDDPQLRLPLSSQWRWCWNLEDGDHWV